MEKYFALIKNNIVKSVAVGDDDFLAHIQSQYDFVVDVTNRDRPTIEDSYYPDSDSFVSNAVAQIVDVPTDIDAEHLNQGTDDGFEPFRISKYVVKYDNGIVQIGCKKYPAAVLLDALYKALVEEQEGTLYCFNTAGEKPVHGKFDISWEDAQKIYDALSKVKIE